jgi:high-affinity nickel-transport protein
VVRIIGLKGRWLGRLNQASHPAMIAFVGALFAFSFDTLSQTMLFSLTAYSMAGWLFSAALGMVFMLGMITTDGLNGLWVSHLINKADERAQIASRVMGLAVGGLSILVGLVGLAKYFFPFVVTRSEGHELLMSLFVIGTVTMSFYLALRLAHRQAPSV